MNSQRHKPIRALGLCSGGLDSMLAGLLLRRQGIEVEWISFETPFFSADKARRAADATGIPLRVQNITSEYIRMLQNPNCGYGQHMNPCMDCHSLMFRIAGRIMQRDGFDFMFSGEVLGQRPMSQTRPSLRYVEKHSGIEGYILRPLSAQKLPETIPEKEGWVDRGMLLDLAGRSRKPQIKLAREFGLTDFPAPAGGCLLTDKGYATRLSDFFQHNSGHTTENQLHLLRFGRHFRINPATKIIVGRTQQDNQMLDKYHDPQSDVALRVTDYASPLTIVTGKITSEVVALAASICAGYSKAPSLTPVDVEVIKKGRRRIRQVLGVSPADVRRLLIK